MKKTLVILSKIIGKLNFEEKTRIESKDNKLPLKTKLNVPLSFQGGNNIILKLDYSSQQAGNIKIKNESKQYKINFNNIKEIYGEFLIKGELMNKCKREWIYDLSDEEIEEHTTEEYKNNKKNLRKLQSK